MATDVGGGTCRRAPGLFRLGTTTEGAEGAAELGALTTPPGAEGAVECGALTTPPSAEAGAEGAVECGALTTTETGAETTGAESGAAEELSGDLLGTVVSETSLDPAGEGSPAGCVA